MPKLHSFSQPIKEPRAYTPETQKPPKQDLPKTVERVKIRYQVILNGTLQVTGAGDGADFVKVIKRENLNKLITSQNWKYQLKDMMKKDFFGTEPHDIYQVTSIKKLEE